MGKGMITVKIKMFFFIFFVILSFVSNGQEMQKCPAYPDTVKIVQEGNYIFKCFIKGDEHSSITTTVDGYPLIENKDGKLEYAIADETGKITSTGITARNEADRKLGELKFLKTIDKNSIARIQAISSKISTSISSNSSYLIESFPTTGTRNLLVILIDFTDLSFQIANNNFNNLMNQENYNGTGSFRDYWLESSYNNLTVNSTVRGWYHAANSMAYYGANSGGSDVNPRLLVQEAIDAAENAGTDFSDYDNDNDGNVDGIVIVHAGYGEEAGGGANTIWSHHWTLDSYKRTYDGVTINEYAIVPELRNSFGSNISNIGVICHEFGHSLGLPDLYDTDASNGVSEGIGEWGLMGSGNWNNNGATPSNLCIWSKVFLSWSNPIVLRFPTSISLSNSAQNNISYRVNTPHAEEYFLLENRQLVGFDVGLPGTGLAIWHVNTSKTTSAHFDANDVNADENLKGVDLEEADGNLDLDNNTNRGDDGDLFPGNSCNLSFNDFTTPNSQTYSPVVSINKPITHIAESNNYVRFDFSGYNAISGNSVVCSSGTSYRVINLPDGDSITWDCSSYISRISEQGANPCIFAATGQYESWIEATIHGGCGDIVVRKNVWAGLPNYFRYTTIPDWLCSETPYIFIPEIPIGSTVTNITGLSGGVQVPLTEISSGYFDVPGDVWQITLTLENSCGSETISRLIRKANCLSLLISPNPSSGETTLTIESDTQEAESMLVIDDWDLEVYNQGQQLKAKKTKIKGKSTKLNTSGWKEGVYVVRANYQGEVLTGKLVVK